MENMYYELFEKILTDKSISKIQPSNYTNLMGFANCYIYAKTPFFYIADCISKKYLHIESSKNHIFGYEIKIIEEKGPDYFTTFWHRNDFKIYNEKILPETIMFLKRRSIIDYPNFSFSFNYRFRTKSGNYLSLLQRSSYFLAKGEDSSLQVIGSVVDITNYKEDSRIIHTVENIDGNFDIVSQSPLFKSIHYPEKCYGILSKREIQILESLYQGMSSKEIAEKHCVSINTINNHRKNMLKKTNTKSSPGLVAYAFENGLLKM